MHDDERALLELQGHEAIVCLKDKLERKEITRRDFVQRLALLGIGGAVAGLLAGPMSVALADTPVRGGRIRAAHSQHGPDDTLDPAKFTGSIDFCRGEQFYDGLTRINPNLVAEPALAESWEAGAGATEWVFKLRGGVEFVNGKSLEAQDVVYSITRHLDENVGSGAKSYVESVEAVTADDKRTVRFKLNGPNADFPIILGLFYMKVVPDGHTDFTTAVGTGPFILKEFNPGVRSLAERNPNYWDDGKPYLDEIEWFGITDTGARLNALLAGDILMMSDLDPKAIPQVEETAGVSVSATNSGSFGDFVLMGDRSPTDNKDLRLAIKYLLDREKTLKTIQKGYGMIANDHPISPVDPFYCDDLAIRPFDPDRAKHHLKKAGMDGGAIQLHTSDAPGPGTVEQALLLQQNAAKIGFTIDVKRDPTDGYWSATWMQVPFHMSGWNMRPTADIMLSLTVKSDAPWNESQFKSDRIDELLVLGRAELDTAKRKEIYCEAQRLIHEDGGMAIATFVNYIDAMSDKVQGFEPIPIGPLGASQWPKYVWLES